MLSKISVLIPTRRRLDRLGILLSSYAATVGDEAHLSELIFRVDDDDHATQEFLSAHQVLVGPRYQGYRSLPTFFNELAAVAQGDVVMCGNDDMIFRTPCWASVILTKANEFADGLFDIGVHTHNELHYPFAVVSKKVVDELGFLFDPQIFWGDIYLRDVMGHLGRCVMLPEVEIDHDWVGYSPDSVFIEGEGARRSNWMGAIHEQAVARAVTKLRELMIA